MSMAMHGKNRFEVAKINIRALGTNNFQKVSPLILTYLSTWIKLIGLNRAVTTCKYLSRLYGRLYRVEHRAILEGGKLRHGVVQWALSMPCLRPEDATLRSKGQSIITS